MLNRKKLFLWVIPVLLTLIVLHAYERMMDIRFQSGLPESSFEADSAENKGRTHLIGVVSRYSPSLLYKGYQPLIDYLNAQTPYYFELRINDSYEESVVELAEGQLEASFLGTYVFIKNVEKYPIAAFIAPLNRLGRPFFQAVVITREDFPFQSVADFSNRKIGVPSAASFSGNWLQGSALTLIFTKDKKPPVFIHYDYHHTVVQHIIRGQLAGGVVKDRVAEEYKGKGVRIVSKSRLIPASPLVMGPGSDREVIAAITECLTAIKPDQNSMLKAWDQEFRNGFTIVKNSDYGPIKDYMGIE